MTNISQSKCRQCGQPIFWHKSRTGKSYPTDSATDRRAFHQCEGSAETKPATNPETITPDYFQPSVEQRLDALEKQVSQLSRTVREVQSRQPITAEDMGF